MVGRRRALNDTLRKAIFGARLSEADVAVRLQVDPKTVRRWLDGRLPYPKHRWSLSSLVDVDEEELWPEVQAARAARSRSEEITAVYAHRWLVARDVWRGLFASAESDVGILVPSGLFLAED